MSKEKYEALCEALEAYKLEFSNFEEGDLFIYSQGDTYEQGRYVLWVNFDEDDNYIMALEIEADEKSFEGANEVEAKMEEVFNRLSEFIDYEPTYKRTPATLEGGFWNCRIEFTTDDVDEAFDIAEEMISCSFDDED